MTTTARYTAVGTTDENTQCDCCGRTNLKMTVVLRDNGEANFGEHVFFGRTCAARATGWRVAYLDREVIAANNARERAQGIADRHAAYLADGEAGILRYIRNNWRYCQKFNPRTVRADVEADIRATVAEYTAKAAIPTRPAA